MSENRKTISINAEHYKRILAFGVFGEHFSDVIEKILILAEVAKAAADPKFVAALEQAKTEDEKEAKVAYEKLTGEKQL